ncbi:hypothetical protein BHM03_00061638 [Ensete ventricosum]|nr:hypothetical protein BHM03_00061638 [Ensete ventricosum]
MSPEGLNYPKVIASIRTEMDSEECRSVAQVDLSMVRKGRRCETTNSRVMGLAVAWYHSGETSVEISIPCFHEGWS